jgi:hypothetical protein
MRALRALLGTGFLITASASAMASTSCATEANDGDTGSTGDAAVDTSSGDSTSSTGPVTTTSATGATSITTTTSAEESSSTGFVPTGPYCSVQNVTHDELFDPLPRGEQAGVFPAAIADVLEDNCGCHTLMSGGQNLEWENFQAPGGTLFLQYADLSRPFESGTLGQAIESEVRGSRMPVGSCPRPPELAEVLLPWFDQGMPDGANYVP